MAEVNVGWWNLENLFDHETAPRPDALKSELKGWTAAIRDQKIAQLASIIELMFGGQGPDVLGVCEVENESVLARLANTISVPGRNYQIVSHASPDSRGIDVSFIIDSNRVTASNMEHQIVVKRAPTRDLFWATFTVDNAVSFVGIANHWPSRSAGQYTSEPFRILAGEALAFVVDDMLRGENGDKELPIVAMGDFNDEPFNRSMQEYLLGTRDPARVRFSKSGHLLNCMWPLMQGHDPCTYLFSSDWNMLDQFLVSYGLLKGSSPIKANLGSVEIFRPGVMKGTSGRPRRFSRPSTKSGVDNGGFSDHFPTKMKLTF